MKLKEYLQKNRIISDGAMGTYYNKLKNDDTLISENGNINEPEVIESIHKEYIRAGARLIRTNTFAANSVVLSLSKKEQEEMIRSAVKIAKKAAGDGWSEDGNAKDPIFIAGDIGPIPMHAEASFEEILEEYKWICDIFIEEKVSAILFETFSDVMLIKELTEYVKQKEDMFVIADFCLNKNGYTALGISANRIVEECGKMEGLDAVGFNCGIGSGHMYQIINRLSLPENKFIVSMPNAGYPEQMQNRMVFMDNADYFVDNVVKMTELGLDIIGGCCGTTPEYIEKLVNRIQIGKTEIDTRPKKMQPIQKQSLIEIRQNAFYEKLKSGQKVVAVELDPPYDSDYEKIMEHAQYLKDRNVDIITMADSPGGRSRADSILMSVKLANNIGIPVMPHICCRDKNMIAMRSSLLGAYINDIRNVLFVTGDPVPSVSRLSTTSVFDYNSVQLMNFMKEMNQEHFPEDPIVYGGALNYGRGMIDKIVERMKRKIDAGASYFLTQPVYSKEDMERIHEIKQKVDTKILCGIMPFTSYRNANFVKNEIAGIHVPDEIVNRYSMDMTKEEAECCGAAIANEIIEQVSDFVDGYYFMLPFNRVSFMDKIIIK